MELALLGSAGFVVLVGIGLVVYFLCFSGPSPRAAKPAAPLPATQQPSAAASQEPAPASEPPAPAGGPVVAPGPASVPSPSAIPAPPPPPAPPVTPPEPGAVSLPAFIERLTPFAQAARNLAKSLLQVELASEADFSGYCAEVQQLDKLFIQAGFPPKGDPEASDAAKVCRGAFMELQSTWTNARAFLKAGEGFHDNTKDVNWAILVVNKESAEKWLPTVMDAIGKTALFMIAFEKAGGKTVDGGEVGSTTVGNAPQAVAAPALPIAPGPASAPGPEVAATRVPGKAVATQSAATAEPPRADAVPIELVNGSDQALDVTTTYPNKSTRTTKLKPGESAKCLLSPGSINVIAGSFVNGEIRPGTTVLLATDVAVKDSERWVFRLVERGVGSVDDDAAEIIIKGEALTTARRWVMERQPTEAAKVAPAPSTSPAAEKGSVRPGLESPGNSGTPVAKTQADSPLMLRAGPTSFTLRTGKGSLPPYVGMVLYTSGETARAGDASDKFLKARIQKLATTKTPVFQPPQMMTGLQIMADLASISSDDTSIILDPFMGAVNKSGAYGLTVDLFATESAGGEKGAIVFLIVFCKDIGSDTKEHTYDFADLGLKDGMLNEKVLEAIRSSVAGSVIGFDRDGREKLRTQFP